MFILTLFIQQTQGRIMKRNAAVVRQCVRQQYCGVCRLHWIKLVCLQCGSKTGATDTPPPSAILSLLTPSTRVDASIALQTGLVWFVLENKTSVIYVTGF